MFIKNRKIQGPNKEIIVIPRLDEDIVLTATAILDFEPFNKMCPEPQAPTIIKRGEGRIPNLLDEKYKQKIADYGSKRLAWIIIESLKETEGLQWETVKLEDPNTWLNWDKELKDAGFSQVEINRIINGCMSANALSEDKIEQARQRFLRGREQEQNELFSQNGEQQNTLSGGPAKDSI